jgi:DnaA regulatory inactivator Hda
VSVSQLAFDLGHRPALGRDDFLVAPCNAEAVAWLDTWPEWPGHALALFGPAGCGKTHLLAAFAQAHGGVMAPDGLRAEDVAAVVASARVVTVDGIEACDETALFHVWNLTKETGRHLVLASRDPPARLDVALPDLRSRLSATAAVGIGAPDDALLAALLIKQFADRQLKVGEDVVTFLLSRMDRSFAGVRAVAEALDKASLAERRAITVPLARAVREGLET